MGKTSISCGIICALGKLGHTVQPFKVGPDYIDPGYLELASGNPARNLDVWLMGKKNLMDSFVASSTSDVSVVEGVMGYFDGFAGDSNASSTHHVASILRAPVVLVLDASRTSRSIAATALGFKKFHRNSRIRGIILNRLASPRHEGLCRQALKPLGIPVVGCVPRDAALSLDSRHLGLVVAPESASKLGRIAEKISGFVDAKKIIQICKTAPTLPGPPVRRQRPAKASIGVALDDSFNFYYQDNLDALRRAGLEIKFFSPVDDTAPPRCDGLYIGGGFPEIRAQRLAKNRRMKTAVKKFAQDGGPVYAECGGLMYLADSITSGSGDYKMAGVFDVRTIMTKRVKLNYTKATVSGDCITAAKSQRLHGHEFHYSEIEEVPEDSRFAYDMSLGEGIGGKKDGLMAHNTLASYGHLYFDSKMAQRLAESCIRHSRR